MFILDRIDRERHSLERLELKFDSRLEFFYKIPVRILLDVLFRVFRLLTVVFRARRFLNFFRTFFRLVPATDTFIMLVMISLPIGLV